MEGSIGTRVARIRVQDSTPSVSPVGGHLENQELPMLTLARSSSCVDRDEHACDFGWVQLEVFQEAVDDGDMVEGRTGFPFAVAIEEDLTGLIGW